MNRRRKMEGKRRDEKKERERKKKSKKKKKKEHCVIGGWLIHNNMILTEAPTPIRRITLRRLWLWYFLHRNGGANLPIYYVLLRIITIWYDKQPPPHPTYFVCSFCIHYDFWQSIFFFFFFGQVGERYDLRVERT